MKTLTFFLFSATIIYVSALPAAPPTYPKILKSGFDLEPEGQYQYGFETENGITKNEVGEIRVLKNEEGKPEPVVVVRGSYVYQDKDGQQYKITYIADENGFQPEGAHLPHL